MPKEKLYTYRNGKKVNLQKEPDQLVVRAKSKKDEKKNSGSKSKGK